MGWPLLTVRSRFEVRPVLARHLEWSLGSTASAELLPNLEGEAFTRLTVLAERWSVAFKVGVEAGAGVRSALHVGPTAQVSIARAF